MTTSQKENGSICFPVPWGVIQAKCWGTKSGRPFLGLHGWLDNANTFDKLAPLLPQDTYLVCIDLPGHGKSSTRPPGVPYTFIDYVIDVKWVITHLEWTRFSLIGHSMGAGVAALYAGIFPDKIEDLILLEYRGPTVAREEDASSVISAFANDIISSQYQNPYKLFPNMEAFVSKLMKRNPELSKESAQVLAKRNAHEVQGGVRVRIDPRLRAALGRDVKGNYIAITQSVLKSILSNIKCRVLVIRGLNNEVDPLFRSQDVYIRERFDVMEKSADFYDYHEVNGNHCVHLNNAGTVAVKINNFLKGRDILKSSL